MRARKKNQTFRIALLALLVVLIVVMTVILITGHKENTMRKEPSVLSQPAVSSKNSSSSAESATKTPALALNDTQLLASAQLVEAGAYDFNTGATFSTDNSQPTPSASVIKVFIMSYIYNQRDSGKLQLTDSVSGESLSYWVTLMIQNSDNAATNVLINHFGMSTLNAYFASQGYQDTKLERLMLDNAARARGLDNYTSLNDCMTFLKRLYEGKSASDQEMLTIMKGQQTRTKIPSQLPVGTVVANKTGELDDVESDIGIVYKPNAPFAMVVLTHDFGSVEGVHEAIGSFALEAYKVSQ